MRLLARILDQRGDCPALDLDGRRRSYAELIDSAFALAGLVDELEMGSGLVGILAHKSFSAYVAVLASHLSGRGYVPLNVKFPAGRLASMLHQSGVRVVVVGKEGLEVLKSLLDAIGDGAAFTLVAAEPGGFGGLEGAYPAHRFVGSRSAGGNPSLPRPLRPEATAYLLFTSGSTGQPKGVPVSFANLEAYASHVAASFPLVPGDRASQTFDMTFDLSVHDIFATWSAGACLCPVGDATLVNPAKFIRDRQLTAWFSVPSVAMFMARGNSLRAGAFPRLRLSLFCGEPLPVATAEAWSKAAPGSRLINLYGPTEATVAIAEYEWPAERRPNASRNGLVPIGRVFPSQRHCLLGDGGRVLTGPGRGELCLSGTQVTEGYLNAPEKTAAQFVQLSPAMADRWYRTGDLVERGGDGVLHFIGRIDHQVKVNGYRVELGEVESTLRDASGCDGVAAVPWPAANGAASGLVAFILGEKRDEAALFAACRRVLPDYMVPSRILWRDSLPLNANGKVDRRALAGELDRQPAS